MTARSQPPFHADQVGSLLRPRELLDARQKVALGTLGRAELRKVEDKCIREAVAMQESLGLKAVTDGEFRRTYWHVDFLVEIEGIREKQEPGEQPRFKVSGWRPPVLEIAGKVRHAKPIMGPDFDYLRSVAKSTPKVCIPAPGVAHFRGGRAAVDKNAYPEMGEFWRDLSAAYRAEVADLARRGCRYLQFDEVFFAYLCDAKLREQVTARGEDPDETLATYVRVINDMIAQRRPGTTIAIHICRGNARNAWAAAGGYGAIAEIIFPHLAVDAYLLEYDDDRSGDFVPLKLIPRDKKVVLGLVTTKHGALESADALRRRLDEAGRHFPLANCAVSPQCGFASTVEGNDIEYRSQVEKLRLVVDLARAVWGSA